MEFSTLLKSLHQNGDILSQLFFVWLVSFLGCSAMFSLTLWRMWREDQLDVRMGHIRTVPRVHSGWWQVHAILALLPVVNSIALVTYGLFHIGLILCGKPDWLVNKYYRKQKNLHGRDLFFYPRVNRGPGLPGRFRRV